MEKETQQLLPLETEKKHFCPDCIKIINQRIRFLKKLQRTCREDQGRAHSIQQLEYLLEENAKS